jgi:amino acid adenylation domain-containing protein
MITADTLPVLFEDQVARDPNALAVVFEEQTLTYAQLNKQANQLAWYLRSKGVQAETPVAFCMARSEKVLISILGILKAGGAYVPIDATNPQNRLDFILEDNQSPLLIITEDLQEQFKHYQQNLIILDQIQDQLDHQSTDNPPPISTPQNLAYIIYTSGSTGVPKGVMIEQHSVVNYSQWFANYIACRPRQRIDFSLNYCFDMAVCNTITALIQGFTVVICREEIKKNILPYLNYLQQNQINIIKITPSYFKLLLHEIKNKWVALPYLNTIILAGENLTTADCASWFHYYPNHHLFNEYGPTEATVAIMQYPIKRENIERLGVNVPIGYPAPGVTCLIQDLKQNPVPDGEEGELIIGGACLARGYLNQPELTKTHFIGSANDVTGRRYRTGDRCRKLPDGAFDYLGRLDSQVKIRGFRIELGEIEKQIAHYPAIGAISVQEVDNHRHEKQLIAYYILKNKNQPVDIKQLRQMLQTTLPEYMIPAAFVSMEALPLTANHKLDFSKLPKPDYATSLNFSEPKTDLEKKLADIWSEELGITPIGLDDDYFELGGHSLSAARIVSTINHRLEKEISLHDIYSFPSLRQLAEKIQASAVSKENRTDLEAEVEQLDPACLPLSDFQFMLWASSLFEPKAKKINISARKRLKGHLHPDALKAALSEVLRHHELLLTHPYILRPAQWVTDHYDLKLVETNLSHLSSQEQEARLNESMQELIAHYPWSKKEPMLKVRLFTLSPQLTEIQLSMPHIISDNFSTDIVFQTLSDYYLFYADHVPMPPQPIDRQYRNYIALERAIFQRHLENDIDFWENYLKEVGAFVFPAEQVITDMSEQGLPYSTYLKFPPKGLSALQQFCATNHLSIQDGLCAAVALALNRMGDKDVSQNKAILINRIKSTRDKLDYEKALGCFLRLEPIKVSLTKEATLPSLSRQIHQAVMDTSPYQHCSNLIKLACIQMFREETSKAKSVLINLFISLYTSIFHTPKLNRKTLAFCARLSQFARNNQFLINVNIQHQFLANDKKASTPSLFGLKSMPVQSSQPDQISIDYLLEVCLLRENDRLWLVISANLKPDFRQRLGQEIIKIINSTKS